MPKIKLFTLPLLLTLSLFTHLSGQITVGPGGDFATLEDAAPGIDAGDTVIVLNGLYSDGSQFLSELHGTPDSPIVIVADSLHGAIFSGGTEAIHLIDCSHLILDGFVIEQQTGNGINIDDGGDYSTPTHHITVRNCLFRDMAGQGNNDFLKLSGLDSFLVENCSFINGGPGGSGIDMVGCHWGVIQDNWLDRAGVSGIQAKGGTQHILMRRNVLIDMPQRAVNLGGSTGLQFFRPPLEEPIDSAFEAADLEVYSNVFIDSRAPIAYVGCVRVKVYHNTIFMPGNWVIRILQETTEDGFLPCSHNEFRNNIIYLGSDLTEVNIGPNTEPQTFRFSNNLWYNESDAGWSPVLPVIDSNQVIADPLFQDTASMDFAIPDSSPAVGAGLSLLDPQTDFVQNFYFDPPSIGAYEGHEVTTSVPYRVWPDSITISPNPASNRVRVEGDFSSADIFVIDSSGAVVRDYSGASSPLVIYLSDLPDGLYFIHIMSEDQPGLYVTSIIKM